MSDLTETNIHIAYERHPCILTNSFTKAVTSASVFKIKELFFGILWTRFVFKIMKIINFWGDLPNISVKKEALAVTR